MCSSTSWLSLQGAFAPRVWVKMFICYQPLVPEVEREAKLPLRIDSEDLLGVVQLCFQNVLTYLHNKTNQNNINGSGELLDAGLQRLHLAVGIHVIFPTQAKPKHYRDLTRYDPMIPVANSLLLLLPFGERGQFGCSSVGTNAGETTDNKSTQVNLSFCHIE